MDPFLLPPFLALPREIRDIIYSYLLVQHHEIPIECAIASTPGFKEINSEEQGITSINFGTACELYALDHPVNGRSTWPIRLSEVHQFTRKVHLYSSNGEFIGDGNPEEVDVKMTYQLGGVFRDRYALSMERQYLGLEIMLVCHQVYREACEIFYSRNTFSFINKFTIPIAFYFFADRPLESRSHIRSIQLSFMEQECNSSEAYADQYVPSPSFEYSETAGFQLRNAYNHFEKLCGMLASPSMHVRHLALWAETLHHHSTAPPTAMESCLRLEQNASTETPAWLAPLLNIKDLVTITLAWSSDRPQILRQANMAKTMRDCMLKKEEQRGPSNAGQHKLDLKLRLDYGQDEGRTRGYRSGKGFVIKCNVGTREIKWRPCAWRHGGMRLNEETGEVEEQPGRNIVRTEFLDRTGIGITCCCQLKST